MDIVEDKVLDLGFLKLVDFMGGDLAVVQAARVSVGKGVTHDIRDKKLVEFLLAHKHETPFEHSVFKFHVKCPIFVARQWFRHRISSFNEISGRYTEMKEEFCLPDRLRTQKARNYQYMELPQEKNNMLREKIALHYESCYKLYRELLDDGVAKEHARLVLPQSLYTQFYWTVNGRALMNFLALRLDEHAQYEIRQYAEKIAKIFSEKMPWSYEAFEKYVLAGEKWSEEE
ncbi:FAD-dependent thymidylate synthase [candidate division KSB1 bacterium]|nr:FAD-dependent thymidylate synthase [candidate division KSB1 bacterium]